jgi:hypothetical protein
LGSSDQLLTLGFPSAWLLECLSNLSQRSRLALSSIYPLPTLRYTNDGRTTSLRLICFVLCMFVLK